MEDTFHRELGSHDFGPFVVQGNFTANGGSAIDNTLNVGKGWTVARASAGTYTVTFTNWTSTSVFLTGHVNRQTSTTNDDFNLELGAYSGANGTFTLRAKTGAVATDVPANDIVCFELKFLNSGAA